MNYTLAKELNDAGFKPILGGMGKMVAKELKGAELIDPLYAPTLSELIEACGDKFECLYRIVNTDLTIKHWQVHGFDIGLFEGKTPEEAVARLWLALNKK